jgi:Zn-dependent M28 family amino/carboxypeptidase
MIRIRLLAATALALAATPLAAQTFDTARLAKHVRTLSSDAYEGRAPATNGEQMTVDYLIKEFRAAGLQPGGDLKDGKRQWTQAVPLLKSDMVGTPQLQVRASAGLRPLVQGEQIAVRSPLNGQTQVRLANAPLLFVGYGVTAPERQWDDFKNTDVRGKVIVVLVNDPDFEGAETDPMRGDFGGKGMTYYGRWTYKFEEAAKRGAAGVLVIHETEPASYDWSVASSGNSPMFDIVRANPAERHAPVQGWLHRDTAVAWFRAAGLDFEAAKAAARRRDFQPVDLKASLTASLDAKTETINSYNVVGLLRGTRRPDETILYTAHHDHLGIGTPDANGDTIFNGAIDNATGTAQLIEQGRAFARRPRTERSVVFLAVGAEEKGLLGAEYYVANPLYPLAKTVAVLNTDSLGVFGPARNFGIAGTARLDLLDAVIAEGARRGRSFSGDPRPEAGSFFRSDHFAFAKAGVPAISWRAGTDLVNGGNERGMALLGEYSAKRYHQRDDEYLPTWDFSGIAQDAGLLHAVGRNLANSADWPNWSEDSEFRAIRDRSGSERGGATTLPAAKPPAKGERG